MADNADLAGELLLWEEVQQQRMLAASAAFPRPGARYCADCGDEIPQERRRSVPGCRRCVECQTLMEWRR